VALRASLSARELPATFDAGRSKNFEVIVRNVGGETWPSVGDALGDGAVSLRARWLRPEDSHVAGEGGAARIPYDMEPGDTAGLGLNVSAPAAPGDYILELDVVQDGSTRPGARPRPALRARVKVSPPG
jgi:hypothetical protein